jgi:uncharacterized membrane protein YdcZ (DUF606 family)
VIEAAEKSEQHIDERTDNKISGELWLALLLTLIPFFCLAVPLYVIRPFRPQAYSQLAAALTIRNLAPWVSAIAVVIVGALAARVWARSKRILPRLAVATLCLLVIAGAALTTVNLFEVMFHPYPSPEFTNAGSAQVDSDDKVLAVRIGGEARAYPIRTMGYHHIVNDVVGGAPIAVTYCTLCHTGLVWSRILDGRMLHFRLAGINNGNALMRDEETDSIWQQSTGEAIFGRWKGKHLEVIHSDELTFALWQAEQPAGTVLKPNASYASEYEPKDWEKHVESTKTVIDTSQSGIAPHELMLGVTVAGHSEAFPLKSILAAKIVQEQVGTTPIVVVVGSDKASIRIFHGRLSAPPMTFTYTGGAGGVMRDEETGSEWNFAGCAIAGKLAGQCLQEIDGNKDYWFDWLNHHPGTQVFRG